jgi:hypothetical protein
MSIEQIHLALENGMKVNWFNSLYELQYVNCEESNTYGKASYKNGKAIRVSCIANCFGSLLSASDLEKCFIKLEEIK